MEFQEDNDRIESIRVDSMVWSELESALPEEDESMQLRNATHKIRNAAGIAHIKPDYGSLGEFMKDVGISKDILMHNRK